MHTQLGKTEDPQSALSRHANRKDAALESVDLEVLSGLEGAQLKGDPDLIVELIDLYLTDAPCQIAVMQTAIAEADEKSFRCAAHSLRGGSANLGVRRVAAICEQLEYGDHAFHTGEALLFPLEQELVVVRHIFETERQRRL
jgi:HPt (histidine-containing phosphotransfer) domain-containing protein